MTLARLVERLSDYRPRVRPVASLSQCAVLVPIINTADPYLVYTKRAPDLRHHGGQISFPGGRIEEGESPKAAALREAQEEVNIEPGQVRLIGQLDDVYSPRGFHIQSFVGLVGAWREVINPAEVDDVVRVRLAELSQVHRHQLKPWPQDPRFKVHYFSFEQGLVWGVTGWITAILRAVMEGKSIEQSDDHARFPGH